MPYLLTFLRRLPGIMKRNNQTVTSAIYFISETDITKWFCQIQEYIKEKKLGETISEPSGIDSGMKRVSKRGLPQVEFWQLGGQEMYFVLEKGYTSY